ncbi:hypothetical protein [Bdellovibrio sp. HCB274]|uniref:hypothetical protein n=1 Tax=Bdellovibrio sp. HCB274 TaxID=3394361 RepID=UPI0039B5CC95
MFTVVGAPLIVAHGFHGFYRRSRSTNNSFFTLTALLAFFCLIYFLPPKSLFITTVVALVSQVLFVIHFSIDELFFEKKPLSLKVLPEILVLPFAILALHLQNHKFWGFLFLVFSLAALIISLASAEKRFNRTRRQLSLLSILILVLFFGKFQGAASVIITYTALVHFLDWYEYSVRNSNSGQGKSLGEILAFLIPIQILGAWYYFNTESAPFLAYIFDPHYIAIGIIWHVGWSLNIKSLQILPASSPR